MRSPPFRSLLVGLTVAVIGTGVARAQTSTSLADLNRLAGTTSTVIVTDTAGRDFRGRITDASESRLTLRSGHETRTIPAQAIRSVRLRQEDSRINGTVLGAAVVGGLESLMFLDNECRDDPVCYQACAVYSGIGALAGFGIDSLIHRSVVLYSAAPAKPVVTLSPFVLRGRSGVRVLIAF